MTCSSLWCGHGKQHIVLLDSKTSHGFAYNSLIPRSTAACLQICDALLRLSLPSPVCRRQQGDCSGLPPACRGRRGRAAD